MRRVAGTSPSRGRRAARRRGGRHPVAPLPRGVVVVRDGVVVAQAAERLVGKAVGEGVGAVEHASTGTDFTRVQNLFRLRPVTTDDDVPRRGARLARRARARDAGPPRRRHDRPRALRREPGLAAGAVRRRLGRHRVAGRVRRPGRHARRRPRSSREEQARVLGERRASWRRRSAWSVRCCCATAPTRRQARYLRPLLRADEAWCQLFSEPRRGQRPREPRDARRARRRRVRRERAEGVDVERAPVRLRDPARRARTSTRRSTAASRSCSSICTRRASRSGRCARSPAPRTSTRCSSPTCASRSRT